MTPGVGADARSSLSVVSTGKSSRKSSHAGGRGEGLKVLEKTLRVLDLFTGSEPEWTVTEIARAAELPTPTAYRILRSLEGHAYLFRTDGARYRLGVAAMELGRRAMASMELRSALRPVLRQLGRDTHETVILSVYDERHQAALCVDRVEPDHSLRLSLEIGSRTPLHAGASSKAMLAYLDEETVEEVLDRPLEALAPQTITDPERLRAERRQIRRRGWSYSYEETDVGAWGLSAPILTRDEHLLGVLGIVAPTARHSDQIIHAFTEAVREGAREGATVLDRRPSRSA